MDGLNGVPGADRQQALDAAKKSSFSESTSNSGRWKYKIKKIDKDARRKELTWSDWAFGGSEGGIRKGVRGQRKTGSDSQLELDNVSVRGRVVGLQDRLLVGDNPRLRIEGLEHPIRRKWNVEKLLWRVFSSSWGGVELIGLLC